MATLLSNDSAFAPSSFMAALHQKYPYFLSVETLDDVKVRTEDDVDVIREWAEDFLSGPYKIILAGHQVSVYLHDEHDVTMFKLRWMDEHEVQYGVFNRSMENVMVC